MLEEQIVKLTAALEANTVVLQKLHDLKVAKTNETVPETPKKVAKKKTAKKTAEKVEPEVVETEVVETKVEMDPLTGQPIVAQETAAAPLDPEKVQSHLRGIAAQLKDTSKLFALIQQHGGAQFSELDPSVYPQLIADAEQLVVDGA